MIKKTGLALVFITLFSLLPLASAEIFISQMDSFYNLGNPLNVHVTLNPGSPINDFLTVTLDCGANRTFQVYRSPYNLNQGQEVNVNFQFYLSKPLFNTSIQGLCNLRTEYGGENTISNNFEISKKINLELNLQKKKYNPGNKVSINGIALQKSGLPVDGFVEISVDILNVKLSKTISQGNFSYSFDIPENAAAGDYVVNIKSFQQDSSGAVINEGNESEQISVLSIRKGIEIILDSQNVKPGESLKYKINALDQANNIIGKESISAVIYKPGDFVVAKKVVKSGEENVLKLDEKDSPGYWKIDATLDEFSARKLFYIEEVAKISPSLINDTLIVTNIGNVIYKAPIEIGIGSAVEVIQLEIKIGETKKFKLSAPTGTYSIRINDGNENSVFGSVPLTGNAVKIRDLDSIKFNEFATPILWFFGIIALILIFVLLIKSRKKKMSQGNVGEPSKRFGKVDLGNVMYGKKEEATVITIKVGGNPKHITQTINNSLTAAKGSGAKVYIDSDYRIIVYSPSLTKNKENEILAVKTARQIEEMFKEHNRRFKEKISFGIGVSKGEIISEIKDGQFKFTAVGNLIAKAKRLAGAFSQELFISDNIQKSVGGEIKTQKADEGSYRITRINDRGKHQDFLDKFLDKNK